MSDELLQFVLDLPSAHNGTGPEISLTLPGVVVIGTLVSAEVYAAGIVEELGMAGTAAATIALSAPDYVHLRAAAILTGPVSLKMRWWRGSRDAVVGFSCSRG